MSPGPQEQVPGPVTSRRWSPFAAQLAEAAVHALFVSAAVLATLGSGAGQPIRFAPAAALFAGAFLAGALLKLGDDLEDEAIHATAGRLITIVGVACLAAVCSIDHDLLWLVAGGVIGVLLAGKVDRPAAIAGLVLFVACGATVVWAAGAVPRVDLCAIGTGSVLADELLAGWARDRGPREASSWARVLGWGLRSRFLVSAAVLAAYLVALIGAAGCLAALLFDLGYATAGAAVARFLAKNPIHSAPAVTRRPRNSAENRPNP